MDRKTLEYIDLVVPGGGIIGNIYLAGLKSLTTSGYRISHASGSSAGSIVALVASTLSEERIEDPEFWKTVFELVSRCLDGQIYTSDLADLLVGTMNSIQDLKNIAGELVRFLLGSEETTFESADLDNLAISAYEFCGDDSGIIYFSKKSTPTVRILDAVCASCSVFFFGKYTFEIDGVSRTFMDAVNIQDIPYSCFIEGCPVSFREPVSMFSGDSDIVVFLGVHDSKSEIPLVDTIFTWRSELFRTQARILKNISTRKSSRKVYTIEFFEGDAILEELILSPIGSLHI